MRNRRIYGCFVLTLGIGRASMEWMTDKKKRARKAGLKAALMAENGRGMYEDHIQRSATQVQNRIIWSSTDSPE